MCLSCTIVDLYHLFTLSVHTAQYLRFLQWSVLPECGQDSLSSIGSIGLHELEL